MSGSSANPFYTRSSLATLVTPRRAEGLLALSSSADTVVPIRVSDMDPMLEVTRATLIAAGADAHDRVLVTLNADAELGGNLLAHAYLSFCDAVASVGPRGRMRLLWAIQAMHPTTLVTTPSGAQDLLSRLHMEFLVDPQELGLERLVLTGEIPSRGQIKHLAAEFGVPVTELFCEPVFGVAVGYRNAAQSVAGIPDPRTVGVTAIDRDELVSDLERDTWYEFVVSPIWSSDLSEVQIRTGQVARLEDHASSMSALPQWSHTVGDHVLVRGRWLSLPRIDRALRRIDGVAGSTLDISRPGSLDKAVLRVALDRSTLSESPMWLGRIKEAVAGISPVQIDVETLGLDDWEDGVSLVDHRGQHLGVDRSLGADWDVSTESHGEIAGSQI